MYKLRNNPVLKPHQIKILTLFFASNIGRQFFLTGGTALAAFYLGHRFSKDLDLFSLQKFDSLELEKIISKLIAETKSRFETRVKTEDYWEIYLKNERDSWTQRIDFVREQPVVFGDFKNVDGVIVDDLVNIATNKILTIYGRLEAKDYVDLYFILKETDFKFDDLFEMAKKKDAGLHEFYFGNIVRDVERLEVFPEVFKPFDQEELKKFFLDLSTRLLKRIKPPAG